MVVVTECFINSGSVRYVLLHFTMFCYGSSMFITVLLVMTKGILAVVIVVLIWFVSLQFVTVHFMVRYGSLWFIAAIVAIIRVIVTAMTVALIKMIVISKTKKYIWQFEVFCQDRTIYHVYGW